MDEFDLIQEAVSNWESLYEIEAVDTCELPSGDADGRPFVNFIVAGGLPHAPPALPPPLHYVRGKLHQGALVRGVRQGLERLYRTA